MNRQNKCYILTEYSLSNVIFCSNSSVAFVQEFMLHKKDFNKKVSFLIDYDDGFITYQMKNLVE